MKGCRVNRADGLGVFRRVVGCVLLFGLIDSLVMVCAQIPVAPQPTSGAAQASLREAQKLIDAGDFRQAAITLKGYLQAEPGSATAHEMLAYTELRLDDAKGSLEEYTRAAAIERPSAVDLQNVAKDYVLVGDMSDAEHWAIAAVRMDERDAESWYVLGRIRFTLQRFQEAVECFQHSLVLLPRSVKAESNLGLSYEGLNRTDDAIEAYRQAIAWQRDDPHPSEQPLLNLGIIFVHQEKLDEAREVLTKAVAIAPRDPRIREQLGHLYLQLRMLPEAQQQFEAAIALQPKRPELHFLLGKVFHEEGQEQRAKAEFALSAELSGYKATPEN
jgi:tetratricopeptide (TPR) repeat protein